MFHFCRIAPWLPYRILNLIYCLCLCYVDLCSLSCYNHCWTFLLRKRFICKAIFLANKCLWLLIFLLFHYSSTIYECISYDRRAVRESILYSIHFNDKNLYSVPHWIIILMSIFTIHLWKTFNSSLKKRAYLHTFIYFSKLSDFKHDFTG